VVTHTKTLEPDMVLLRTPVANEHHYVGPEQVLISVEIVSPGTKKRDRFYKPEAYARAGVPHYWRIEQSPVHVFAYDLAADGSYQLIADSDLELVLTRPVALSPCAAKLILMTADLLAAHRDRPWSPDTWRQRMADRELVLERPFAIRLPIGAITA
jgi:hypothetical protein